MRYLFELKVVKDDDGNPVVTDHHFTGYMSRINDHINDQMDELVGILYRGYGFNRLNRRVQSLPVLCRHWVGTMPETFCESNADVHKKGFGYFICSGDTYHRWDLARYELPEIEPNKYDSIPRPVRIDTDRYTTTTGNTTISIDGLSFLRDLAWEPVNMEAGRFHWIAGPGRTNVQGNNFQEPRPPEPGLPDQ